MIKTGEIKVLIRDNIFRGKLWDKKGEKVEIISVNGTAVIYQNTKGNRYPCSIKDLEEK